MLISGSCHCGNIGFELRWEPEPTAIPARACTCSFCTKHGGVWTSCPTGSLVVTIADPAGVSRYVFGTKTAEFHVCAKCGVVPVVTSEIDGKLHAVVSVNAFRDVDRSLLEHASASFDAEDTPSRLSRRKRNWIPNVRFTGIRTEVEALKQFFAAINRNDMQAMTKDFDPRIVRVEPEGFPTAGTYRGIAEVQEHVRTGRGTWAEGSCDPENFLVKGDKVVVFLDAWVRLKGAVDWTGGRFADGFVFRDGKIIEYLSFAQRADALAWAGIEDPDRR